MCVNACIFQKVYLYRADVYILKYKVLNDRELQQLYIVQKVVNFSCEKIFTIPCYGI